MGQRRDILGSADDILRHIPLLKLENRPFYVREHFFFLSYKEGTAA